MFNARAPVITNIQIHLNINAKMARDYSMLAEEITLSCVFGQFVFQKSIVVLAGDTRRNSNGHFRYLAGVCSVERYSHNMTYIFHANSISLHIFITDLSAVKQR